MSSHEKALSKSKLPPMSEKRKSNILKLLGNKRFSPNYQDKLLKQK